MKILYFYPYFGTSRGSWGTRVHEFGKEWVKSGHQVTVVTAIYAKSDLRGQSFLERQNVDGIELVVLNIHLDNKQSPIRRIISFLLYALVASWFALTESCDVVIASSGPLTTVIPGLLSKMARRKPFVFEVRDLWPDTAVQTGYLTNQALISILYSLERIGYREADLIITLSPGMTADIRNRFGPLNIQTIPNGANTSLFNCADRNMPADLEVYGIDLPKGGTYAIYMGNIGQINRSHLLFETALELKKRSVHKIPLILVGDGPDKEILKQKAVSAGLRESFIVLDLLPKEDLVPLLQHALVSLVPLADSTVLNTSSPNKLFESLAAGVPVIQTTRGWIAELLEREGCGLTVSSEDPAELADRLVELYNDRGRRDEMSRRARVVATSSFDTVLLSSKMLSGIEDLVKGHPA